MNRRAFTLIEMILTLGLLVLIAGAVGGVVSIAGRANQTPDQAATGPIATSDALARLLDELALARSVSSLSGTAVTFTVADTTGDNIDDTITYTWSGSPGSNLTRSINGAAPTVVAQSVNSFALAMTSRQTYEPSAAAPVEHTESLLASYATDGSVSYSITTLTGAAQFIKPVLDPQVSAWRPTRVELRLAASGATTGQFTLSVYRASALTPAGTLLYSVTVRETGLPASAGWVSIPFVIPSSLATDESIFITLAGGGLTSSGLVFAAASSIPDRNGYSATTATGGVSWSELSDGALNYRLYGRLTSPATSSTLRTRLVAVAAQLRLASDLQTAAATFVSRPDAPVSAAILDEGATSSITGVFDALSAPAVVGGTDAF